MKLILYSTAISLLFSISIQAQDNFSFGHLTAQDFHNQHDQNTDAVILFDLGSTKFEGNKNGAWVSYVYEKHKRVQIFNKKSDDLWTIRLNIFGRGVHS